MREGEKHAGDLILRHNSILAEDLEVQLSFDTEGEIVIPEIVVIPAGESEVVIPVTTLDDGVTDGGKLVSVYADDESGARYIGPKKGMLEHYIEYVREANEKSDRKD